MATLNAPNLAKDQDEEEPPAKRTRLHENSPPSASLESLNPDCLFTILSFLHYEDLNSMAICSSRYRKARAHEALDQNRSGTITVRENWTAWEFSNEAVQRGWNLIFQGNRTELIIEGIGENWSTQPREMTPLPRGAAISGVTSLVLSDPHPLGACLPALMDRDHLLRLLPNIVQVKFLHTGVSRGRPRTYGQDFRLQYRPNLQKLSWIGCEPKFTLDGVEVKYAYVHFQLYIDGCSFSLCETELEMFSDKTSHDNRKYLFHLCPRLERLSIKNAICILFGGGNVPVPQDIIIKMVRHHPGLRWLRSDLSEENVAVLQQERPDITFVTD